MSIQSNQNTSHFSNGNRADVPFTHLHVHTDGNIMESLVILRELVDKAKAYGFKSLAVTDTDSVKGVGEFCKECKRVGIRPIIGAEIHVSEERYPLVLLATDDRGYDNLKEIVASEVKIGTKETPWTDVTTIQKYSGGFICLSGGPYSEVSRYLAEDRYEEAKRLALQYKEIFGPENYYLEMQDHWQEEEQTINAALHILHDDTGIPLVVTNDVRYVDGDSAEALESFLKHSKIKNHVLNRIPSVANGLYRLYSTKEMLAGLMDLEDDEPTPAILEAMANTESIANRCRVHMEGKARRT